MTETDEYLQRRRDRFKAHLPETDDLALIVLKGHLLIEEVLDGMIARCCKDASVIEAIDVRFYVKTRFARALTGDAVGGDVWEMVDALNALRNELAHKLEGTKVRARVERFVNCSWGRTPHYKTSMTPAENLKMSIAYVFGLLAGTDNRIRLGESA